MQQATSGLETTTGLTHISPKCFAGCAKLAAQLVSLVTAVGSNQHQQDAARQAHTCQRGGRPKKNPLNGNFVGWYIKPHARKPRKRALGRESALMGMYSHSHWSALPGVARIECEHPSSLGKNGKGEEEPHSLHALIELAQGGRVVENGCRDTSRGNMDNNKGSSSSTRQAPLAIAARSPPRTPPQQSQRREHRSSPSVFLASAGQEEREAASKRLFQQQQ